LDSSDPLSAIRYPLAMNDHRVKSWIDLQELLFGGTWQPAILRFRSHFVYRGAPDVGHGLETSLQTGGFEAHERHLLTSFRKYALRNAVHGDSVWNWLSLAKHHGLPTRLLDWSYSPLVAMHFATHDVRHFDEDGAIWMVDFLKTNTSLPPLLRQVLVEEQNIFTTEMLTSVATTLEQFDTLSTRLRGRTSKQAEPAPRALPSSAAGRAGSRQDFVLFFEPPSLDERIVNQFALFSLPSSPTLRLEDLLRRHEAAYRRVIIPAALKWEVRDKLDQANITERVLFPGLDGLSQWLKRYFTTRK